MSVAGRWTHPTSSGALRRCARACERCGSTAATPPSQSPSAPSSGASEVVRSAICDRGARSRLFSKQMALGVSSSHSKRWLARRFGAPEFHWAKVKLRPVETRRESGTSSVLRCQRRGGKCQISWHFYGTFRGTSNFQVPTFGTFWLILMNFETKKAPEIRGLSRVGDAGLEPATSTV